MNIYNTYIDYCRGFNENPELSKRIYEIQDWIIKRKKNSHSLSFNDNLDDLCINYNKHKIKEDALDYVLENVRDAILYIINNPNEKLIREEILIPVNKVKEVSSKGMIWLSRKPGKTMRQKIKNSQSILSVKRRMVLDTTENRLFLEYLKEISKLLQYKKKYIGEFSNSKDEFLLDKINLFLRKSEVLEIKKWENLPPNNTLLSDKNYRKIWDSWIELKKIDTLISNISSNLDEKEKFIKNFDRYIEESSKYLRPQIPIEVDYYNINLKIIRSLNVPQIKKGKINIENKLEKEMEQKVSTNLLSISTSYYTKNGLVKQKNNVLIQKYIKDDQKYIIPCNNSEYIYMDDENINIDTFSILTELESNDTENLQKVMELYKDNVNSNSISFVIPDAFDDFKMINLNKISRVYYNEVKMVPKSIASMYAFQESEEFFDNVSMDTNVLVFDIVGYKITYTLLRAKENKYLKNNEDYVNVLWERISTNYIKSNKLINDYLKSIKELLGIKDIDNLKKLYELGGINGITADFDGMNFKFNNENILFNKENLDKIYKCKINIGPEILDDIKNEFNLSSKNLIFVSLHKRLYVDKKNSKKSYMFKEKSILEGCYKYFDTVDKLAFLKEKYENFALWKDYLPDLGIKLIDRTFELTNKETIIPIIGKDKKIDIRGIFTLPKDLKEYKFDLLKKDITEKEYELVLNHSVFPLKEDLNCKLKMIYRYGNETPIELIFIPENNKNISIVAKWRKKEGYEYKNLFIPEFPKDSIDIEKIKEFSNIFEDTLNSVIIRKNNFTLNNRIYKQDFNYYLDRSNYSKKIVQKSDYITLFRKEHNFEYTANNIEWIYNRKNGTYFTKVNINLNGEIVRININENNFIDKNLFSTNIRDIKFDIFFRDKGEFYAAYNVMPTSNKLFEITGISNGINIIKDESKGYLLAGLHYIFRNGRTINQIDNIELQNKFYKFKNKIIDAFKYCNNDGILIYIMSLCYKEFDKYFYDILSDEYLKTMKIFDIINLSYSLGDLTSENQVELYTKIKNKLKTINLIQVLAISIWKNQKTIYNIPIEDIKKMLHTAINTIKNEKNNDITKIRMLEFIYGIFRLRIIENEDILKLLSKNNKKIIELQNYLQNEDTKLRKSRIKFDAKNKPNGMHDLVYAILVCIYGSKNEDIKITEIDDKE